MMKKIIFCFVCFISFTLLKAQEEMNQMQSSMSTSEIDSIVKRKVAFLSKYQGDSVVLRWMPVDHNHWLLSRNHGFLLVRGTFDKNKTVIKWDTLNQKKPIMKWSKEAIENHFQKSHDSMAYAAKALLYKKKTDAVKVENFSDVIHKRDEHGLAHLMATILGASSPMAANAMGLRYVDRGLDKRYTYGYYLHSMVDTAMLGHDNAYTIVDASAPSSPVTMPEVTTVGSEKCVALRWDKSATQLQFLIYYIERSTDGVKWHRLNHQPYFPSAEQSKEGICTYFEYKDSVETNYKPYFYRVLGVDDFGDITYSSVVKGHAIDQIPPDAVSDLKLVNTKGTSVVLSWNKKKKEGDFAGYIVGRSNDVNGPFDPVNKDLIPASATTFTDENADPHGFNFYIVAAVDTASNASMQMPVLAAMKDDIPPLKPANLQYTIDTSGAIHITWDAYNAPDFDGYLVLVANQRDHEFTPVSHGRLMEAHFEDTILIKTLTKRIYYKVITFDKHNNASEYSDILEVMKPDLVVPVTPVIHNYYVSAGSVAIEWHVSTSDDVKLQALYRKEIGGVKDYTFITNLDPQTNKYRDGEVIRGKSYEYMLQAIDSSGLKSEFSYPLHVSVYGQSTLPQVKNLKVSKDKTSGHIHIDWDYSTTDVPIKFVLYRSNDSNIEQYKYTSDHKYVDSFVPYTDKVTYAVKAISDDGAESALSDMVTFKIEK